MSPRGVPEHRRREMHCGWLPPEQWLLPGNEGVHKVKGYSGDICPAWLVRQPAVLDVTEAYVALSQNALDRYDPEGLNVIWEAAMRGMSAFKQYEAEEAERAAQRR